MQKSTLLHQWQEKAFVKDQRVLDAFKKVKREDFILKNYKKMAYEDIPLPIGWGATISQPTTVVIMTEALEVHEGQKILEIGTGSGYQAALLSLLTKNGKIFTTEIIRELAEYAKSNLKKYTNVEIIETDGSQGYQREAPYDRIIFTVAIPKIEQHILDQLKDPGILLAPVGNKETQELIKIKKQDLQIKKEFLGYFQFVPLKGKYGFK